MSAKVTGFFGATGASSAFAETALSCDCARWPFRRREERVELALWSGPSLGASAAGAATAPGFGSSFRTTAYRSKPPMLTMRKLIAV
eukprot:scaffold3076_cov248-Pinguiococcus_pyrenoidosus.AAC.5